MNYKIVVDSCGDLPQEKRMDSKWESVPLTLMIDDYEVIDDENFDQKDFIRRVAECPNCPKSSCPSPERYMQAYDGGYDCVFVVALSGKLSGSYNSAVLGKNLFQEQHPEVKIHVFNSCSASVGQYLQALKAEELAKAGNSFEEIVEQVEAYSYDMETYFILQNLETLRKNGRLTGLKSVLANVLNIKPVMGATKEGVICQYDQARGMKKALEKLAELLAKNVKNPEQLILGISHCNCPERADEMKKLILEKITVKNVVILDMGGVSTLYANDGGMIVVI